MYLVNQRIVEFINEQNMSLRQFALSLGYNRADKFYQIRDNIVKASTDIIEKISNKYVNLNIHWLMTGKGEMFLDSEGAVQDIDDEIDSSTNLLKSKDETIKVQQEYIEQLKSTIETLKEHVEKLGKFEKNYPAEGAG